MPQEARSNYKALAAVACLFLMSCLIYQVAVPRRPHVADREVALLEAATRGDVATVHALAAAGTDLDAAGPCGDTAMHRAVMANRPDAVRFLLSAGARVDAANDAGQTPLMVAAWLPDATVARVLLAAGADVGARDGDGRTPMHWAARSNNAALVRLLAQAGADVRPRAAADGSTPLELATGLDVADAADELVRWGALGAGRTGVQ